MANSEAIGGDDAEEATWFPVEDMPEMAFDHKEIIAQIKRSVIKD
jgi:8-oxo-dGTP diphosphatase